MHSANNLVRFLTVISHLSKFVHGLRNHHVIYELSHLLLGNLATTANLQ